MEVTIPRRAPIALSDQLPLRKTTAWGQYKDVRLIPHVYGRTTVDPVPYDKDGYLFVLADHSIQGVDRVEREGTPIAAFDFRNEPDDTGHGVAVLELSEALTSGETLAVDVRGKMDVNDGSLLTEPAEVLWDVVSNIGGQALPLSAFDRFRTETADKDLNGVISEEKTLRAQVDELMLSVGGIWSGGMPGFARLYPAPDDPNEPARGDYTDLTAFNLTAESSATTLITRLRILYQYDYARKLYKRVLEVTAPDAVESYGDLENELDARWIREPAQAAALAERLIEFFARPLWNLKFNVALKDQERKIPRPGTVVSLNHTRSPANGRLLVSGSDVDVSRLQVEITATTPAGNVPRWTLSHLSTAHEPLIAESVSAVFIDGVATFTILDDSRRPLSGASVTIDGGQTKVSDKAGRVQFTATKGPHQLVIVASGFADRIVDIVL